LRIESVYHVGVHRLCVGCGACFYKCPEKRVRLFDIEDDGIRPILAPGGCNACGDCLDVCPGLSTSISDFRAEGNNPIQRLEKRWGAVLEVWEGYAADPEIRYKGSSGGLCTALSLFCLEKEHAGGVLHIGSDREAPWKNKTDLSCSRKELIAATGSRYAPASPCDGLEKIEASEKPCVLVGKPCDLAGLRMAQKTAPELDKNTCLAIGFFCAGTPSTQGTLDLLKQYNVDLSDLSEFRYRGLGWPGKASAWRREQTDPVFQVSYEDSWGFVQKYRPFRCYLCPDLTAEFADISVGDPWYRKIDGSDPGRSLILIRTEKGRRYFKKAVDTGYVEATPADEGIIYRSQKNLLGKRQAIWGRLLAMKMLGIPYPRLEGFHLFANWLDLPAKEKVKSILGTAKRIIQRNYFKPLDYTKYTVRF